MKLFYAPARVALGEPYAGIVQLVAVTARPNAEQGFFLWAEDDHLELHRGADRSGVWIPIAELERRARQVPELVRACGIGGAPSLEVVDATAGLGVDGVTLALLGAQVTLLERHPAAYVLASDLVRRAAVSAGTALTEAGAYLRNCAPVDVVYLDPMFPERRKRALPGKRMQYLAALVGADPLTPAELLLAARGAARQRVVLKRRRHDPVLERPDWQILGRTVRYDVYRGSA
ncbi:MAG: class I SAM-dependent methyltransferase [Pseudomonadales bacterium]